MGEKLEEVVVAINQIRKLILTFSVLFCTVITHAQEQTEYKKRVLESTEVDLLMGYYEQNGNNAAVTGGIGNEYLTDISPSISVSVPISADEILKIDATVSAYTSASSSNIDPFDSKEPADAFVASSGASSHDIWVNSVISYSTYSDDRNVINNYKLSISGEYDYFSVGIGASQSRLFNEKNTELSYGVNIFIDTWNAIYPYEIRLFEKDGPGANSSLISNSQIIGAPYNPTFERFSNELRTSYSASFGFSQILSQRVQMALMADLVLQEGLLSTPFQRVYFADVANSYIDDFHLAEDIEKLPHQRKKVAVGARLNAYLSEFLVARTFVRYYVDDWGVSSTTAQIELPIKIGSTMSFYPTYRYYEQEEADYFAPYDQHLRSEEYYTSDYDLSTFSATQIGLGVKYTDIFLTKKISIFGLKSLELRASRYQRNNGFKAMVITTAAKFVMNP